MAGPFSRSDSLRACFKTTRGAVFGEKAGWQGATQETALRGSAPPCFGKLNRRAWEAHTPGGSSTEEQRRQPAFSPKTLRAAGDFGRGRRWPGRHSPLRGCSDLAALATAKIPSRSTPHSFKTGSEIKPRNT